MITIKDTSTGKLRTFTDYDSVEAYLRLVSSSYSLLEEQQVTIHGPGKPLKCNGVECLMTLDKTYNPPQGPYRRTKTASSPPHATKSSIATRDLLNEYKAVRKRLQALLK